MIHGPVIRRLAARWRRRRREESGYVAIFTAIMFASSFLALAATSVDTANWYVQAQKIQNAADAAALGGVVYMPQDLTTAQSTARAIALRNGYDNSASGVTVTAEQGGSPSQLKVTVSSRVRNTFGALIGVPSTTITRSAVADFTGPAPMGSPCNTLGNEPSAGGGVLAPAPSTGSAQGASPFANCPRNPQFWSTIQGPETGKVQGDRFMTMGCESAGVDGCDGSGNNTEYSSSNTKGYQGYFFVVKVGPQAVGKTIDLQLFDPAFVYTAKDCSDLSSPITNNLPHGDYNDYTATDQVTRYGSTSASANPSMCPGDYFPRNDNNPLKHPMTTSFVLRNQTDTQDPMKAGVTTGTDGKACIKQYAGYTVAPTGDSVLREWGNGANPSMLSTYNAQLSKVFHQWTSLCSFTPTRQGDFYLQVRTNVALGGTPEANVNGKLPIVYQGNAAAAASNGNTTIGDGTNGFAVRAVVPGYEKYVAVAGYDRMPLYQNGTGSSATFNLIRVLPGARGYSISFSFFDVGDAVQSATGSIKVLPPTDATGSITTTPFPNSCSAVGGGAGAGAVLSSCAATISSATNNGKLETMTIPIPSDYNCDYTVNNGCWYRVQVTFPSGVAVTDTTTWTAGLISDPVRLVQ